MPDTAQQKRAGEKRTEDYLKLIIAEKPSLARSILSALSQQESFTRKDGYFEGDTYLISYAFGHLFGLIDLEEYFPGEDQRKWNLDILPFFPGENKASDYRFGYVRTYKKGQGTVIDAGVKKQFKTLETLMNRKDVTQIIHCGDADREGEVIVRLILMKGLKSKKKIDRLWLPDQTTTTILSEIRKMKDDGEYDSLFYEGLCRTIVDWMYGINLTRYMTLKVPEREVYNVGRVLTPIVQAIYERDYEIEHFVPKEYYQAESNEKTNGEAIKLTVPEKFEKEDYETVKALGEKLNNLPAVVKKIETKRVTKKRPKLFSLSKLQGYLGRKYKISMNDSLKAVQSLYDAGYMSYPRTNTEYMSESEKGKVRSIIEAIRKNNPDRKIAFRDGKAIFDDTKIESHSALTPTTKIPSGSLSTTEQQVYDTVLNRFCAVFCEEDCIANTTTMEIACGDYTFKLKGEVILQKGFLRYEDEKKDTVLPKLKEGDFVEHLFQPVLKKTEPPKHYNSETLGNFLKHPFNEILEEEKEDGDDEDEYRQIMKGVEIGTEATRTPTITKAIAVGYISQKKDYYYIEPKGRAMVAYLNSLSIKLNKETSVRLQVLLKDVFHREKTINAVLAIAKEELVKDFDMRGTDMKSLYEGPSKNAPAAAPLGECPLCGKAVAKKTFKNKEGKIASVYSCEDRECGFAIWPENAFFKALNFHLTDRGVKDLLRKRKTLGKMKSNKTGKDYEAYILFKGMKGKYPEWGIEFKQRNDKPADKRSDKYVLKGSPEEFIAGLCRPAKPKKGDGS